MENYLIKINSKECVIKGSNSDLQTCLTLILKSIESRIELGLSCGKNSNDYISAIALKGWLHWKTQ